MRRFQEAERHTEALDTVTTYLGMGSYRSWTEPERRAWLEQARRTPRAINHRQELGRCAGPVAATRTSGLSECSHAAQL